MDINERLQQEQLGNGTPKINPDEQSRYLGTFRERVIVAVKVSQLGSTAIQSAFAASLKSHSIGKVLIDQNLASDYFAKYVGLATQSKHPFTLLSDATKSRQQDDPIAVLLAANTAVNVDNIYLG
ncbi:YueI family protein [Leuconostoc falkenbergense]|uniref:YueI family protein n=1 Tax=Leuconostoc falkenbergense TaxID=2766470 RepID=UPI003F9635E6